VSWWQRRKIRKSIAPDPALVGKYKVSISLSSGSWSYSVYAYGERMFLTVTSGWTGKSMPVYGWVYVDSGSPYKSEAVATHKAQEAVDKHKKETAEAVTMERLV
jgi:hypothetical protein